MKISISKTLLCGVVLMVFPLVMGSLLPDGSQGAPALAPAAVKPDVTKPDAVEPVAAAVSPVTPPPDFPAASPFGQVVRLTQAGVDPVVIMTYVTNSTGTFNLDSDRIIYLSDLGAPTPLVTAMMERDQQLHQEFIADQAAQQVPEPTQNESAPVASSPAPAPAAPTEVAAQTPEQPAPVTPDDFNNTLTPYGSWVVINGYGRCWQPAIVTYNSSWQPYCDNGQWTYTDCGWYWNSSYAWGATFHYGRWFNAPNRGWCWYPGTVWAPSWVTWRYSNNYCGWAPLPPRTAYQTGVGIVYNGGNVSVGFNFGLGASCYTFVPTASFCKPQPRRYCVAPTQVTQVFNNTTIINNYNLHGKTIINQGIAVQKIAIATHAPIRPVPVQQIDRSFARGNHVPPADRAGQIPGANRPFAVGKTFAPQPPSASVHPQPPTSTYRENPAQPIARANNGQGNNRPARVESPTANRFPQPGNHQTAPPAANQFTRGPWRSRPSGNNQVVTVPTPPATTVAPAPTARLTPPAKTGAPATTPSPTPVARYTPPTALVRPRQASMPQNNPVRSSQPWLNNMARNQTAVSPQPRLPAQPQSRPQVQPPPQPQSRSYNPPQNMTRQNIPQPPRMAAPQRSAPSVASTTPPSAAGARGGNSNWPPH